MSDYPVVRGARPGDPHPRLRLAALTAVIIGVVLVAVAAFLFSYTGIRQIALQAGVSPGLARLYPLMFDAMLIVTCSAVLATRAAGWGTKSYVWVCLLIVVGAVAVGNALYATGVHLTGQAARAAIAVIPWVLLLMGFGIWLVMLRHWRRVRAGAVNGVEAGRAAPGGPNGQAGRGAPAERAPQAAPAGPPERAPQAGQAAPAGLGDRAAQAVPPAAAGAAAGGAVSWAAGRGATAARTRAPRVGIDTLLEQQAGRAPERPRADESPAAANQAAATGQGKQRTAPQGERPPAAATAAAGAAAAAAGIAAGTKPGTTKETKPETTAGTPAATPKTAGTAPGTAATTAGAADTAPGTAAATAGTAGTATGAADTATGTSESTPGASDTTPGDTTPGAADTTPGAADTTPGAAEATAGTAEATPAGAGAAAGAGATKAADPAETGRAETGRDGGGKDGGGKDGGGKGKAPAPDRRRRLGGLLEMPADADDEEGSVRILPAQPKARPGDAASGEDGVTGETEPPAAAAEPDPANPPAPLPHFDRPRSTPTPPQDTGADGE
jgi:hypothetical protein